MAFAIDGVDSCSTRLCNSIPLMRGQIQTLEMSTAKIILASGAFLALHFGFWVTSLDYTSLTHSLLFVTAHPLVILIGMFFFVRRPNEWNWLEAVLAGAAISMLDAGDVQGDRSVTFFGDQMAFLERSSL